MDIEVSDNAVIRSLEMNKGSFTLASNAAAFIEASRIEGDGNFTNLGVMTFAKNVSSYVYSYYLTFKNYGRIILQEYSWVDMTGGWVTGQIDLQVGVHLILDSLDVYYL